MGATGNVYDYRFTYIVSIHAPVMGATVRVFRFVNRQFVSIHAPVMGATAKLDALESIVEVSIHAPVMGATGSSPAVMVPALCFNPRARDGRDNTSSTTATIIRLFQSTRP